MHVLKTKKRNLDLLKREREKKKEGKRKGTIKVIFS
jgi:hypothetical protein